MEGRIGTAFGASAVFQFHSSDLSRIEEEYRTTVEDCHLLVLRVIDRLGMVSDSRYEWEGGIMVLAMAGYGKIRLYERLAAARGLTLPDGELQRLMAQLQRDWVEYFDEWRQDAEAELRDHFEKFLAHLELSGHHRQALLTEAHDVGYFFGQRDTMELFLMGIEMFRDAPDLRRRVEALDAEVRPHLFATVVNREYTSEEVEMWLAVPWLPENFWWRRINWRIREG